MQKSRLIGLGRADQIGQGERSVCQVWGGKWLASSRKFDANVKHEAVKRTSEMAKEDRRRRRTTQGP